MQSDRASRMTPAIIEWYAGPALVAGPQFTGRTARRRAAALHSIKLKIWLADERRPYTQTMKSDLLPDNSIRIDRNITSMKSNPHFHAAYPTALFALLTTVSALQSGCVVAEERPRVRREVIVEQTPPPPQPVIVEAPPPVREIVVNVPPPPLREEVILVRPSPHHIWIAGYWRHDGRAFVWVSGRWERPPHQGFIWFAPRWEVRGGRWVFIEGRWDRRH